LFAFKKIVPLLLFSGIAFGVFVGTKINTEKKDKFSEIIDIIENDYVDSTVGELIREEAIVHLLSQLDPHSSYIPPQLSAINEQQIRGNFDGLGIENILFDDSIMITKVMDGSSAQKAGLKEGDRMLKANMLSLLDSNAFDNLSLALEKSTVQLSVFRRSVNKSIVFNLKKASVVINSSKIYYMVNQSLGYIKIDRFSSNTHQEFLNSLTHLKQQGLKDLILDLRNNGGGLLAEAVAIANEFLAKNDIITYTKGNKRNLKEYIADGNGQFKKGKLILLTNQNTASSSEILTGAMQDHDRAVVLGNRTFGKGLVQEPFRLPDGSTIRLTTARYYTPSGRSIQKTYSKNIDWYRNEIFRRNNLQDTLNPVFDSTVVKDFFSTNGRLLTIGGGIRPDVILKDPISDSFSVSAKIILILNQSKAFDIFIIDYYQNELSQIKKDFPTMQAFNFNFQCSNQQIEKLQQVIFKKNNINIYQYNIKQLLAKNLKAAIAYKLYGENGKSQLLNLYDGIFSISFDVLKNYNRILNINAKKSRKFDY